MEEMIETRWQRNGLVTRIRLCFVRESRTADFVLRRWTSEKTESPEVPSIILVLDISHNQTHTEFASTVHPSFKKLYDSLPFVGSFIKYFLR